MGKSTHRRLSVAAVCGLGLGVWFGWGCSSVLTEPLAYRYFAQPPVDDAWGHKIETWQARERAEQRAPGSELPTPAVASGADSEDPSERPADLRSKYADFRRQAKRALALELLRLPEVVERAIDLRAPNHVAEYAHSLAGQFNRFYDECHILSEEDALRRASWLSLASWTLAALERLLDLLGFSVPDRM